MSGFRYCFISNLSNHATTPSSEAREGEEENEAESEGGGEEEEERKGIEGEEVRGEGYCDKQVSSNAHDFIRPYSHTVTYPLQRTALQTDKW